MQIIQNETRAEDFSLARFWIMESNRRERDEDTTVASSLKRTLRHNGQISVRLSTATLVGNL